MSSRNRRVAWWLCGLSLGTSSLVGGQTEAPTGEVQIQWEGNLVHVSRVTPGGEVAFLGVTRRMAEYNPATRIYRELAKDDDGDGVITLELDRAVRARSVWVAVDLATGQFAAETPGQALEVGAPSDNLLPGPTGLIDRLLHHVSRAELLLTRPRVGAWGITAVNGGQADEDGASDADLTVGLSALRPLGTEPPPRELQVGDVLVMVDLRRLNFYAVRLR